MAKHEITVLQWDEIEYIECWTPREGLESAHASLAAGKKAVILRSCGCGCMTQERHLQAIEMVGEDESIYYGAHEVSLDRGYPVIILPKELRGQHGCRVAVNLPWKPNTP